MASKRADQVKRLSEAALQHGAAERAACLAGIADRDVKPSNVLVAVQGHKAVPKIIDFGVAKATSHRLTEHSVYTEFGQLIGTPEYMSPEQAEMTNLDIDSRTDVYSLGVLLYELLVGAQPFDSNELRAGGLAAISKKLREREPPRPSTRVSSLGASSAATASNRRVDVKAHARRLRGDLDWITMKAMDKDLTDLGVSLARKGDYQRAEPLLREAVAMARELSGSVHRDVGVSLTELADVLVAKGEAEASVQLHEEASEIFVKAFGPDHWRVALARSNHVACLRKLGRHRQAEALLLAAHPVLEKKFGDRHWRTRKVVGRIVDLYEAWGKPEKAAPYRASLQEAGVARHQSRRLLGERG
jgi:serine/threonine protein kinase